MMSDYSIHFNISLCGLFLVLSGCGGSGGSGGTTTFSANMNSASQVGRARVLSSSNAASSSTGISDQDLVSINSSGTVAKVFNSSFPIYGIKLTTNYIIASGAFVSSTVVDQNGKALDCYLYAISKTAQGKASDLICLSTVQVGDYDPSLAATNPHYAHLGFATRGNEVYFTDYANGILYSWTEGATAPTKIFSQTIQSNCPGFDDVFLDPSGSNICVLQSALASCTDGFLYCGTDSGLSTTVTGTGSNSVLAETREVGTTSVATDQQLVTLSSLVVTSRTANGSNGGLPEGYSNIASDTTGGLVYIGYAKSLGYMSSTGTTCEIATLNGITNSGCSITDQTINAYFQALFPLGNYAWTYGSSNENDPTTGIQLNRINLTTDALDSTNYMSTAGMSAITGLYLLPNGQLVVIGTNSSGAVVSATIDSSGNITQAASAGQTLDILLSL